MWAREERAAPHTLTELAAQHGRPPVPRVRMDGLGYVDPRLAHIPEIEVAQAAAGNGTPSAAKTAPTKKAAPKKTPPKKPAAKKAAAKK